MPLIKQIRNVYSELGADPEFIDSKHKLQRSACAALGASALELWRVEDNMFAEPPGQIHGFDHFWAWVSNTFDPDGNRMGPG